MNDGRPDAATKRFFPKLAKGSLLRGYIASRSQHSTGTAIDLPSFARTLVARIRTMLRIERDLADLASADDRMLRDIGLDRSEVERAVRFGR